MPLYNPLLLKFTVNLLGITCHKCFSLKADEKTVAKYAKTLRKLRNQARRDASSGDSAKLYKSAPQSFGDEAAAQSLLEQFFAECGGSATCARCGATSPKYILDGTKRILQLVSSKVTATGAEEHPAFGWAPPREDASSSSGEEEGSWSESEESDSELREEVEGEEGKATKESEGEDGRR